VETYVHRIGRTGRAGKEGTAISLVQPFERRKQQQIERHVRTSWKVNYIPTRAQIEARQLEKLQAHVREVLAGERLASFLPIVRELSEEYDAHAIAAAALQMAYDKTRPAWMQSEDSTTEEERPATSKPIIRTARSENSSVEEERPASPKPILTKRSQTSVSKNS
jgi:ATP-dependent RNA helicase DeaD